MLCLDFHELHMSLKRDGEERLTVNEHPASSITSLIKVRPARSTWVSCSLAPFFVEVTHLFPKDHHDFPLALKITALDFLDGVVCFAFAEGCRVDTIISAFRRCSVRRLTQSQSSKM
jgi:hypothetical protein